MALEKYDVTNSISNSKKSSSVLDEETYTENLERIIIRDFFPDYGKLKDQKEYLEAEEKKDFEKMREIALKYSLRQKEQAPNTEPGSKIPLPSPATFETPVVKGQCPSSVKVSRNRDDLIHKTNQKDNNLGYEKDDIGFIEEGEVKNSDVGDGLNSFLSKYTSEDNESFENIMERADEARRQKYAWLYEAEIKHAENQKQMLMLDYEKEKTTPEVLAIKDKEEGEEVKPDGNVQETADTSKALVAVKSKQQEETAEKLPSTVVKLFETEEDRQSRTVDTWTYKAKNQLMYYPEGLPSDDAVFKKPYEITHSNTRFHNDPFKDALDRNKLVEAAAENAKFSVGERVGHDGKAILPTASPSVNGFGFVATPSPAPGVNMSPVMTWGVVEGTPARLDSSGTPTPGPSFKFPKESYRDQLMYKMVDENTKKNRAKKQAALRQVKESVLAGTPRRVGSVMSSERINTLSPAARRLVTGNKKLGIASDRRLKASYTPTPSNRSKRGDLTPISKTPTPNTRSRATPKGSGSNTPSITDDLLNIPTKKKKAAASDFF